MNRVRSLVVCVASAAALGLSSVATASAATTVPFQINPATFGNPNGSFDVPPIACAAEVGNQPGTITITGAKPGRWGCLIYAEVRWLNLATGATGSARMSDGLNGFPPEAVLHTGVGQVVLTMLPLPGNATPGFATFFVP